MIHLVTLNPALDLSLSLREPESGKIGEVLEAQLEAGGKALNVARFLKVWGIRPRVWLGTGGESDPTHLFYRALLQKEGLFAFFLGGKAPVRINTVLKLKGRSRKYNHPGFELDLAAFPRLYAALKKGDHLVLTGRLPQGMNTGLYASWVRAFTPKRVKVIIDTSGPALREAIQAKPWFFKVNLFEFSEAWNRKYKGLAQIASAIPTFRKAGLLHGAVTNGSEGAVLWNGNQACWVRFSVKVRGPLVVGAGDGFLAGYLGASLAQKNFLDSAKWACAAGTTVAQAGIKGFKNKMFQSQLKKIKVKIIA